MYLTRFCLFRFYVGDCLKMYLLYVASFCVYARIVLCVSSSILFFLRPRWIFAHLYFFPQELAARQEQIRRETIELEAQLRQKTELERVKMETEGRILAERKNHDLRLQQVSRTLSLFRTRMTEVDPDYDK